MSPRRSTGPHGDRVGARGQRPRVGLAGLAALGSLVALARLASAQDVPWPEDFTNPQPAEGDLVLPMPCGGAMTFRRVDTPTDGPLDDRRVLLGASDQEHGYAEGPVFAEVAGGFYDLDAEGNETGRHYWIGKYEINRAQYAALDDCPELSPVLRLPATSVSWADAVRFADAYSGWLMANDPDALPHIDGAPGFLRLPTEPEWDYAARGGVAVRDEEFRGRVYPIPEGMPAYVWFQGSRSANNRLQFTGLLAPNPLGLHDVLGNADEIMLEPFRLNRGGRMHGQAGAFIVRGGNYLTSEHEIRTSYRQEIEHYRDGAPNRVRTIGFRLVIAAPVLTSRERLSEIIAAWQEQNAVVIEPVDEARNDPLAALERLVDQRQDPALALAAERLIAELRRESDVRASAGERLARALLRLGAGFGADINAGSTIVALKREIHEAFVDAGIEVPVLSAAGDALAAEIDALDSAADAYVDNAIIAAENIPGDVIESQLAVLREELSASGRADLLPFAEQFAAHVTEAREGGTAERERWLDDIARLAGG